MRFNTDEAAVSAAAREVELLLLDADGVLTDGRLYYSDSGEALKVFHSLDGHGIKMLMEAGVGVGIVTGRSSAALARRAEELGVTLLRQDCRDKLAALRTILSERGLDASQAACAGDDLPDLAALRAAGVAFSVPDGHPAVRAAADAVTERGGGGGAVREIADFLLRVRGTRPA